MGDPRIVLGDRGDVEKRHPASPDPEGAWRLAMWVGLALMLVAYGDMAIGLYPLKFGDAQWEFGTFSRLFDSLPLVTMSTVLLLAGGRATGNSVATRVAGLVSVLLAALLIVGIVSYLLTLPLAFDSVTDPVAKSGLKRAVLKTLMQGAVYPVVFLGLGWAGLRRTSGRAK